MILLWLQLCNNRGFLYNIPQPLQPLILTQYLLTRISQLFIVSARPSPVAHRLSGWPGGIQYLAEEITQIHSKVFLNKVLQYTACPGEPLRPAQIASGRPAVSLGVPKGGLNDWSVATGAGRGGEGAG